MAQLAIHRRYQQLIRRVSTEKLSALAASEEPSATRVANDLLPLGVLLARLMMGWVFVWAGFDKLIRGFTAEGFLLNATQGPLAGWFQDLGGNTAALNVINPMVVWGEILIGVALMFGVATRWAAFWGAIMMLLFYAAQLPPEHNPFMEYYLVYAVLLGILGAVGAGRILGLDAWIERQPLVRRIPGASFVLG